MVTTFIWVRFFSSSWSTVLVLLLGSEGLIMLTFSMWENSELIFSWKHRVCSSWNKIVETFHNFFEGTMSRSEPRGELKFGCRTKVCVPNRPFKSHQLLVTKEFKWVLAYRQRFVYQNRSDCHLAIFCIDCTANVCYDFVRIMLKSSSQLNTLGDLTFIFFNQGWPFWWNELKEA